MTLIYAIPTGEDDFESITTANTVSNPILSDVIDPSTDKRMFEVLAEVNVNVYCKIQYSNTNSGPWITYHTIQTDKTSRPKPVFVEIEKDKYVRVIAYINDTEDGQVKVTIDVDTIMPYVTCADIRDQLKIQDREYDDSELTQMAVNATKEIDDATGRTWQRVTTVTDETITPGDEEEVQLENVDIQSITAFSVDDDNDGTYTTVTVSTLRWDDRGNIQLASDSQVTSFPVGHIKAVKCSYTYGNTEPTRAVKQLCLSIIKNYMVEDPQMKEGVVKKINSLRGNKYMSL